MKKAGIDIRPILKILLDLKFIQKQKPRFAGVFSGL